MATMVYQGMPSCLESQFAESRTLRLRLSSPKPHFSQSLELTLKTGLLDSNINEDTDKLYHEEITQKAKILPDKLAFSNPHFGGWSFLHALSNTSQSLKESSMEKENFYVHPLEKGHCLSLSEKSLELCTENLGSETGTTDIIETNILSMSPSGSSEAGISQTGKQHKTRQLWGAKKASPPRSFPPPLTTMSGSESIEVRSHREDGRLVIEAVKAPSNRSYFRAERSNGRLVLSLEKDCSPNPHQAGLASTKENNEERKEISEEIENDVAYDGTEEEQEDNFEELVKEMNGECSEEEMDLNDDLNVGSEMGVEDELQKPGWCKGELENKRLLGWKLCCVASS